jgi:hypothetical protein
LTATTTHPTTTVALALISIRDVVAATARDCDNHPTTTVALALISNWDVVAATARDCDNHQR